MNCSEFEIELEQLVEARGGALTESAVAHSVACAGCRRQWDDQRLVDTALRAWRLVETPTSLTESVLGQLFEDRTPSVSPAGAAGLSRPTPRADTRWGWMAVSAAAACLLTVLGIGMMTGPGSDELRLAGHNSGQPTRVFPQPNRAATSTEVAASVDAVLNDLRTGYRELAAETSATAREFAVVLPASPATSWVDVGLSDVGSKPGMVSKPDTSTDPQMENADVQAPQGTASVIGRSIGTQIGQAMDFLWVAVPGDVPRG